MDQTTSRKEPLMTQPNSSRPGGSVGVGVHLRLVWPRWQGGGTSSVKAHASEFPFEVARRGYAVGSAVLEAVLPPHDGPTTTAPTTMSDAGLEQRDGIEAKTVILEQLAGALEVTSTSTSTRSTATRLCSVSAPNRAGSPAPRLGASSVRSMGS
jgi:arginase